MRAMIRDDLFWHSEPSYDLIEYEQRCCLAIILERRHGLLLPAGWVKSWAIEERGAASDLMPENGTWKEPVEAQ